MPKKINEMMNPRTEQKKLLDFQRELKRYQTQLLSFGAWLDRLTKGNHLTYAFKLHRPHIRKALATMEHNVMNVHEHIRAIQEVNNSLIMNDEEYELKKQEYAQYLADRKQASDDLADKKQGGEDNVQSKKEKTKRDDGVDDNN